MSWLLWCILIAIAAELVIQYCIMRAAYPVLFAPMPDRFNLAGTLTTLPENDETIDVREISFPTSKGLTLQGFLATPQTQTTQGIILFCHPFKSKGDIALFQCRGLLDAGFAVFSFDFRNHGDSDADPKYQSIHWLSKHEISDVKAAIGYLRSQPELKSLPLGLLGMSRGAGAALAVAAQTPEIQFVACEGAFVNEELFLDHAIRWGERFLPRLFIQLVPTTEVIRAFRLMIWYSQSRQGCRYINLKSSLRSLKHKHLLFFVGEKDQSVIPRMTDLIVKRIRQCQIQKCVLPAAIHNAGRFTAMEEYDHTVCEFFAGMKDLASQFQSDRTVDESSEKELVYGPTPQAGPPFHKQSA